MTLKQVVKENDYSLVYEHLNNILYKIRQFFHCKILTL